MWLTALYTCICDGIHWNVIYRLATGLYIAMGMVPSVHRWKPADETALSVFSVNAYILTGKWLRSPTTLVRRNLNSLIIRQLHALHSPRDHPPAADYTCIQGASDIKVTTPQFAYWRRFHAASRNFLFATRQRKCSRPSVYTTQSGLPPPGNPSGRSGT